MAQTAVHVLIIGGGLGGLALAQALKKAQISFHIYERDEASTWRAQGYRIRIAEEGLKYLLPTDLWKEFKNSCAEVISGGSSLDASTGQELVLTEGVGPRGPPSVPGTFYNADRTVLRNVLLTSLEDTNHISFGKKFERYELAASNVTAFFADGSSAHGTFLVGADGTRSVVRRQMVPSYNLLDTEGRAIFGKTIIRETTLQQVPAPIMNGICLIADEKQGTPVKLFCDSMVFKNRHQAKSTIPPDYIYWVLSFHKDRLGWTDEKLLSLDRTDSVLLSHNLTQDWAESCRNILQMQEPEATSTLAFLTAPAEIPTWQADPRLTLIGDAAHPMIPVGGVGATTAFRDAAALFDLLVQGIDQDSIAKYEDEMRQNASSKIQMSSRPARGFFGMKPIEELRIQKLFR